MGNILVRLTGWNAMSHRAKQLGLDISDDQIKAATIKIKNLADRDSISIDQVDSILMKIATGPRTSSSSFVTWANQVADPKIKVWSIPFSCFHYTSLHSLCIDPSYS